MGTPGNRSRREKAAVTREISLLGEKIPCQILYSKRRSIALQIREDGFLVIRLPLGVGREDAMSFVQGHGTWILRNRKRALEVSGERQEYGQEEMEGYKSRLRPVLSERVAHFAAIMGVDYGRISIRNQKTRWGSCSSKGNLNFNWKLALAPADILDYIVVHELAHRLEMNHSRAYWEIVERILPDYRERRAWLKDNGRTL